MNTLNIHEDKITDLYKRVNELEQRLDSLPDEQKQLVKYLIEKNEELKEENANLKIEGISLRKKNEELEENIKEVEKQNDKLWGENQELKGGTRLTSKEKSQPEVGDKIKVLKYYDCDGNRDKEEEGQKGIVEEISYTGTEITIKNCNQQTVLRAEDGDEWEIINK